MQGVILTDNHFESLETTKNKMDLAVFGVAGKDCLLGCHFNNPNRFRSRHKC